MRNASWWNKFILNCQQMQTKSDLIKFFELTLTPAERENIAARYMILHQLLHTNKTHREIAADLSVSIFNVTRGANQLKLVDIEDIKQIIK